MIGQTLGHYQVTGKLGAGGMGVVYRTHDTRLGRDVALKMLPETFLHDSERLARFEREAHVLASLNHPNIATIYGLEESGSGRALVMELVEGGTLAERIGSGPVPLEESLAIARQIAEAIEFAHERGIVHRDLKPANVKLTHDNTVKVLDFGLAKAFSEDRLSSDAENSPTITQAATRAGVVLGTAAYMAPEQAKGKPVDRRADIWAFGIVFMEMMTGRQTYSGETAAETLAFVMTRDPALDRLPPETPPAIRRLLRRCLDRDPRRRLRDIGEARIAIEEVLSGAPAEPAVPGGPSSSPLPSRLPDGRRFLYLAVSSQPEKSGVYAGSLDSKETKRLMTSSNHATYAPGPSGVGYLMFSRANTLMAQSFDSRKLELSGEPFPIAEQVAEAEFVGSAFSASGNGVLAYRSGGAGGITELVWFDRSGKRLQSVGDPAVYSSPALSPDEKRLAVDRLDPGTTKRDIWTFYLVRGAASRLTFDPGDDHNAAWSPDGTRIAFASDRKGHRDLYQKLASGTGEDELLLESAERKAVEDWSPDGRFLFYTQGQPFDVWVLPLFGERTPFPFLTTAFNETQPQFSSNGRWVVYSSNESGRGEIHVQPFHRQEASGRSQHPGGVIPNGGLTARSCFTSSDRG